jgi:class 3 adenylate cyclase/tetratricopeptide (TPR) repeat protein
MNVAEWLRNWGLGQYEAAFRHHDITEAVLPELTDEDFKELGIRSLGHRRTLTKAIRALAAGSKADSSNRLSSSIESGPDIVPSFSASNEAEKRQLTVMFCDLVGSTALSTRLELEELREVIISYHQCCAEVVQKAGGFIAKYMGDGVLVYFGYPQAHEDDAERAVRAGLNLIEAVPRLSLESMELHVRIGIATGLVVVGDLIGTGDAQERTVVGETPNLAARLQALAEPDTVLIAPGTRKLTGALFQYRDLGLVTLKGFVEPVRVSQVVGVGMLESRFDARQAGAPTKLVGREHELDLLLGYSQRTVAGHGCAISILGEPGIGKSRLTRALQEALSEQRFLCLNYYCSPYNVDSSLFPVIKHIERAAGFQREDTAEEKLRKLQCLFEDAQSFESEATGLIARLLSIPTDQRYRLPPLNPQARKEKTLDALLSHMMRLALQQPVLVVFEDLHWIDPTTLELLGLVIEHISHVPLLLVLTARPEFSPPWAQTETFVSVPLARLTRENVTALVHRVTGGKVLPNELLERILARTDGVPLFVEELTKTVLESGVLRRANGGYELVGDLQAVSIPSTLHDSLMARLDRLAPIKELAQMGAVIGREFAYELLAQLACRQERELISALDQLVQSELVFSRGTPPDAVYTFKHALVQDAAYSSLLKGRRQQFHARIAGILRERMPERADQEPELLAHHYTEAALPTEAVPFWLRAGERAAERSANLEAIGHLNKGLAALRSLPETVERARHELALQVALGGPLIANKGYAAPEAAIAATRARQLCEQLGDSEKLTQALYSELSTLYIGAGDERVWPVVERFATLTDGLLESGAHFVGRRMLALQHYHRGEFLQAKRELERILELYNPKLHDALALRYGHDVIVSSYSYLSWLFWLLGFPEQAKQAAQQAVDRGKKITHANSKAFAMLMGSVFPEQFLHDAVLVKEHAQSVIEFSDEMRLPFWRAYGQVLAGWAEVELSTSESGLERVQQGLIDLRSTGTGRHLPFLLGRVVEAQTKLGKIKEAQETMTRGLSVVATSGDHSWESDLHRLRGELLFSLNSGPDEVEASFEKAIQLAAEQKAKSLELRARTSLARFWRERNKRAQAIDLLEPLYNWFSEGRDTFDLRAAASVLKELR